MKWNIFRIENFIEKKRKYKYINGTKGVISIFLALLMVPFTMLAGSLINAARINSAVAIFDEALCNASNSTLGTYDSFLKKRFGLLAMNQDVSATGQALNQYSVSDLISETFSFYLEENLKTLSNTYTTHESESTGVYPLADSDVLLSQILEYSKYSVPIKLVEDGLSINDMIKSLESSIPFGGVMDIITSSTGMANSLVTLGENFELLKTAVNDAQIAENKYDSAYTSFSTDISLYLAKQEEIEIEEQVLQELNAELAELGTSGEGETSDSSADSSIEESNESDEVEDKRKELETQIAAQSQKIEQLKVELDNLLTKIGNDKTAYSSAISTLMGKLTTVQSKLTTTQKDILAVGNSAAGMASTLTTQAINKAQSDNTKNINKLREQIANTTDEDAKAALQQQISELEIENNNLKQQQVVANASKTGYDSAISSMKDSIANFNVELYSTVVENLRNLKNKVDEYDVNNITQELSSSQYYVEILGLLTYDAVVQAEKELVAECTKSSVWAILKAISGFIEALFNVSLLYNPELGAVLDQNYYKNTYGGLPSQKDRTVYTLNYGESSDAELSSYYKSLFGDYSAADSNPMGDMDVLAKLMSIFSDLGVITSNGTAMVQLYGLLNFAQRFKEMTDAAERIVSNIKLLCEYIKNIIPVIGSKILLSGYVSYMTSNRSTYGGKALTGCSFNERGQSTTVAGDIFSINSFPVLISTIQKVVSGGSEKSFVGAETEYIMFGSSSEVVNQTAAFGVIYLVRVLADIVPIMSNLEVQSIAAASTIAAPFVYLIYILVEPLVDTIILVNGGNIPIYKKIVYLTPTGIPSLITKFTSMKLSTETLAQAQTGFLDAVGQTSYSETFATFGGEPNTKLDKSFFDLNYSQTLFLIMTIFTSSGTMLNRMSDIIEMEAVEYTNNRVVGSSGLFDLDYSYTFIRTKASFSTNEFIKINNNGSLNAKERIVYRGY